MFKSQNSVELRRISLRFHGMESRKMMQLLVTLFLVSSWLHVVEATPPTPHPSDVPSAMPSSKPSSAPSDMPTLGKEIALLDSFLTDTHPTCRTHKLKAFASTKATTVSVLQVNTAL